MRNPVEFCNEQERTGAARGAVDSRSALTRLKGKLNSHLGNELHEEMLAIVGLVATGLAAAALVVGATGGNAEAGISGGMAASVAGMVGAVSIIESRAGMKLRDLAKVAVLTAAVAGGLADGAIRLDKAEAQRTAAKVERFAQDISRPGAEMTTMVSRYGEAKGATVTYIVNGQRISHVYEGIGAEEINHVQDSVAATHAATTSTEVGTRR